MPGNALIATSLRLENYPLRVGAGGSCALRRDGIGSRARPVRPSTCHGARLGFSQSSAAGAAPASIEEGSASLIHEGRRAARRRGGGGRGGRGHGALFVTYQANPRMGNTLAEADVTNLIGSFTRQASPASIVSSWRAPQTTSCTPLPCFLPAKGDCLHRAEPRRDISVYPLTSNIQEERTYVLHGQAHYLRRLRHRIYVLFRRAGAIRSAGIYQ